MKLRTPFAAATLVLLSAAALAQTPAPASTTATPRVDARQERQADRIDQGVASGALTARETRRLDKEQAHIVKVETAAKADGTVTPQERQRLAHLQNKASRDIRHQKHDAQTAPAK